LYDNLRYQFIIEITATDAGGEVREATLQLLTRNYLCYGKHKNIKFYVAVTGTLLTINCLPWSPDVRRCSPPFNMASEEGVYSIELVNVTDRAGNVSISFYMCLMNTQSALLSNEDLRNRGFDYEFTVEVDDDAPQPVSIIASPDSVNTTQVSYCNNSLHPCH
jgi:hypothetical protein